MKYNYKGHFAALQGRLAPHTRILRVGRGSSLGRWGGGEGGGLLYLGLGNRLGVGGGPGPDDHHGAARVLCPLHYRPQAQLVLRHPHHGLPPLHFRHRVS